MMEDARTITLFLELLLVSRNLERVADLATNIGENTVFLAEGKQTKHHAETTTICGADAEQTGSITECASLGTRAFLNRY
jgi:phosphate uptake regulator